MDDLKLTKEEKSKFASRLLWQIFPSALHLVHIAGSHIMNRSLHRTLFFFAEKLFPCDDYQPHCSNYAKTGQCRDVWMQKNCRKSCNFCDSKSMYIVVSYDVTATILVY